jgi:Ca2+-binding RTX toxin-like protein
MDWKRIRAPVLACVALAFSAAPALADEHSCDPERLPPAGATRWEGYEVVRYEGREPIRGESTNDFIIGSSGNDTITAGYGRDIVCAGAGDDVIYGGGSSDDLHGQAGRDKLFGELLDDELFGEEGPDVLIGGQGTDRLSGGTGNDWMRGGTNRDTYEGGENTNDNDVASFADTTTSGGKIEGWSGVWVNLTTTAQTEGTRTIPAQTAIGNGEDEVREVESVVGSAFDDKIWANTERTHTLYGGMGSDFCSGGCEEPATSLTAPFAYIDRPDPISGVEPSPPDPVLIAVGGSASETFTLSNTGSLFTVTASAGGSPETLNSDSSCGRPTRGTVTCSFGSTPLVGGQTVVGAEGDDTITDRTAAPNGVTTDLDGSPGNDTITGSEGSETLYSGFSGNDVLHGGNGGDALLALGTGGDRLYGEEGNDQLATSTPCEGHVFRGGEGQDVAGFARSTNPVNATIGNPLGDPATVGSSWYGAAFTRDPESGNSTCPEGGKSWVGADNEILEGTNGDDVLFGNQNDNTFWGRSGDDRIEGANGNDILEGSAGADRLSGEGGDDVIKGQDGDDVAFGGNGRDTITGGDGVDRLHGEAGEDEIEGQRNNDALWGEEGNDRLFGGSEADQLYGEAGNDLLEGGDGVDELFGQEDNDRLRARDGIRDEAVNCGAGEDEAAEADEFDPVVSC